MSYEQHFIIAVESDSQGNELADYLETWIVNSIPSRTLHRSAHAEELVIKVVGKKRQLQDVAKYLSEKGYHYDALPMQPW